MAKQAAKHFVADCWNRWRIDEYDSRDEPHLLLFQQEYAAAIGNAGTAVYTAILGVILTQGIPEAIVAGIATMAVASVLLRLTKSHVFDSFERTSNKEPLKQLDKLASMALFSVPLCCS